jgi:carboxyl-terminal processing protease
MSDAANNTSKQIRLPLLLAAVLAAGMFIGQQLPHGGGLVRFFPGGQRAGIGGTVDEVLRYVEARYVDSLNMDSLRTKTIEQILNQLDPHSVYISPDELKAIEEDMKGNFVGIGIEYLQEKDTIRIESVLAGGPSEAAGLLAGDKMISINDTLIAGQKMRSGEVVRKLRGDKGSKVKVGILRGQETAQRYFEIARDVIPLKSVDIAYMLDSQNGYVKVLRFSERTQEEFVNALKVLVDEKGMRNLVLDLRGNPGGSLRAATDMLGEIFPKGKLLVYTEGSKERRTEYESNGINRFNIQHVVVLIDENSASASEIVAGAIQDWDRGWVVGRRSYGKGLVQEQYPLSNGGAVRITVARYFTPSGRNIQKPYKNNTNYAADANQRLHNGELTDPTRYHQNDTTKFYTGLGRIVYGGGGVSPDVFIPLDTTYINPYFTAMRPKVALFVARYMEQNGKSAFPADAGVFVKTYKVPEAMLQAFVAFGETEGVKLQAEQFNRSKVALSEALKQRLAKVLFGETGFYQVQNYDDPAVEKALQLLQSDMPSPIK